MGSLKNHLDTRCYFMLLLMAGEELGLPQQLKFPILHRQP